MINATPLVSIIIPYFNSEKFLERTIKSIQKQEYNNWELILVDDGSSDGGTAIVDKMSKEDSRVNNYKRPLNGYKSGGRGAKNYGFTKCNGEYIVFFDSDDYMLPKHLSSRIDLMLSNPNADVVFSNFGWKVDSTLIPKKIYTYNPNFNSEFQKLKNTVGFWKAYSDLSFFWVPSNMLWKKKSIEDIKWNEATTIGEDFEYHSQAILANLSFKCVYEVTWYYMRNENSMMATSDNSSQIEKRSLFMALVLERLITSKFIADIDQIIEHFIKDQYRFVRRILNTSNPSKEKWQKIKIVLKRIKLMQSYFKNASYKKHWQKRQIRVYFIVFTCLILKKGHILFEKLIIGKRIKYETLSSQFIPYNEIQ